MHWRAAVTPKLTENSKGQPKVECIHRDGTQANFDTADVI
jgi:hypothetical protein